VEPKSLQETYAPENMCFGCGPKNDKGLRIRSFAESDDTCVCVWTPQAHHLAFPGVLNGGICSALLDCHANWTAAYKLMRAAGAAAPPCTVTSELSVKLKRPTPLAVPLTLRSRVVQAGADRATVEATLEAPIGTDLRVTATFLGIFVAVKEGHPAFHRW
jgi:acyl-coenzyme A thioesterase PaaI-like protein